MKFSTRTRTRFSLSPVLLATLTVASLGASCSSVDHRYQDSEYPELDAALDQAAAAKATPASTAPPDAPSAPSGDDAKTIAAGSSTTLELDPVPIAAGPKAAEPPASMDIHAQLEALQTRVDLLESRLEGARSAKEHRDFLKNGRKGVQVVGERTTDIRGWNVDPELSRRAAARDPEAGFTHDEAVKSYRQAMILYRGRKYAEAILAFSAFLKSHADHPFAGSAQFYIGEAYFHQKEYQLAITEYERVLSAYDRSPHISVTLRQLAAAQEAMKMPEEAKRSRQLLLSLFPQSPAASGEAIVKKELENAEAVEAVAVGGAENSDTETEAEAEVGTEIVDPKDELKKAALDDVPPTAPMNEPGPGSVSEAPPSAQAE